VRSPALLARAYEVERQLKQNEMFAVFIECRQFGAPFRIKLRTPTLLKYLYNLAIKKLPLAPGRIDGGI